MLNVERRQAQRGQAIVETAIFMPLLLMALLALIYFSKIAVLSERAESAVRFGMTVSYKNGNPYTVATVYSLVNQLLNPTSAQLGPLCIDPSPSDTPPPSNQVAVDTKAALTQSQTGANNAFAGPTAKPFWVPDKALTSSCTPSSIALTSNQFNPALPLSVTGVSVEGDLTVPFGLQPFISINKATAQMGFLNVAAPNILLACIPGLGTAVSLALSGQTVSSASLSSACGSVGVVP